MLYRAISCHNTTYHAISFHIMPYRAILCRIMPYCAISCRNTTYHAIPCHITPYRSAPRWHPPAAASPAPCPHTANDPSRAARCRPSPIARRGHSVAPPPRPALPPAPRHLHRSPGNSPSPTFPSPPPPLPPILTSVVPGQVPRARGGGGAVGCRVPPAHVHVETAIADGP